MDLAPPSTVKLTKCPEIQDVSMRGCTADMARTSYELLGLGALKFASRGTRELTCVSFDNVLSIIEKICAQADEPSQVRRLVCLSCARCRPSCTTELEAFRIMCRPNSM